MVGWLHSKHTWIQSARYSQHTTSVLQHAYKDSFRVRTAVSDRNVFPHRSLATLSSTTPLNQSYLPGCASATGFTALPERSLLIVSGRDASSLLQGITTANIPVDANVTHGQQTSAIYSAFLNAQGRLLQDAFIYPVPSNSRIHGLLDTADAGSTFLIETAQSQANALFKWLRRYKLRSRVDLRPVDSNNIGVYFYWDDTYHSPSPHLSQWLSSDDGLFAADNRSPSFGTRVLAPPNTVNSATTTTSTPLDYQLRRYLRSLPEGPLELTPGNALVHDSSLDKANAVDFRKGCYIGQELVIRTQHTGVVRKRILPVVISPPNEGAPVSLLQAYRPLEFDVQQGAEIWYENMRNTALDTEHLGRKKKLRSVGKWIAGVGNVGLASIRLESMLGVGPAGEKDEGWVEPNFDIETGVGLARIRAFLPKWWQ